MRISLKKAIASLRSMWATYQLTGRFSPICVRIRKGAKLICRKHPTAVVKCDGIVSIEPWLGNKQPVILRIGPQAQVTIGGDLVLGPNCRIGVSAHAKLHFGGREKESASGFTENLRLLCTQHIHIGKDFLGAWDIFITDSDHHLYNGVNESRPVVIGDHVWMTAGVSVLKGAMIGDNVVVTQKAVVVKGEYPAGSLLGGIPAKVIGEAKEWHR